MATLYERIHFLCEQKGIKGARMCTDLGFSKSLMTDLKMGRKKGVNADTAQKIASYFDVSVGYLLGEEDKKEKAPEAGASREQKYEIIFNLLSGLSAENTELALKGLRYLAAIPDDKLPEAVRYLQFLANSAEN